MNLPEQELKVLEWWKQEKVFEKSVGKPSPKGDFVFYEGPPTANGRPGIHHVISRQFKDIIPRFKTMQGYRVVRKGGWDTHGLPVELEVEKQLGLKNKKEVEAYGIGAFNKKCKESVWKYKADWEQFTERIAYWVDIKNPYITYQGSYVNGLWAVIKKFWERGLLYEGHKVVPHCPRCGTALSSHELAQGYATVKDTSVTVKFKVKSPHPLLSKEGTRGGGFFILSWTTTPWTLPGNVALAMGDGIQYVVVRRQGESENELLIVAKERLSIVEGEYEVVKEMKGGELAGLEYEPLFDIPPLKSPMSYKVYPADFVSTQDGTGVVHTAVMYGEDDYQLGTQVGLPRIHTVAEDGTFINHKSQITNHKQYLNSKFQIPNSENIMERLAGKFVKDPETERLIIEDLDKRGLIFKKELYEHDYPFCWRCKTPLLYYAKHSWFVAMSKLRNELIEANNQINWVPSYIKEGRFGEWLREVKDWAFSRERYWGTPLPIWQCGKQQRPSSGNNSLVPERSVSGVEGCGKIEVIGSVAELVQKSRLKNRYIFMRHGEAESNTRLVDNTILENSSQYPLTEKGRQQAMEASKALRQEGIEAVISSPFARVHETATVVATALNKQMHTDPRLREMDIPAIDGQPTAPGDTHSRGVSERWKDGESLAEALQRMAAVVKDLELKTEGKTYLIVSHGDPLWVLLWAMAGSPGKLENFPYLQFATPVIVDHGVFLTDERGELDLHRPRVDDVEFLCECGGVMRRVPEVADVWFDSGAMPFVQYPENIQALTDADERPQTNADNVSVSPHGSQRASAVLRQFPADYISEAIDQTRGWFYTLLAVSVALGKGTPYKNVICLGHILDAKGKKMSKSLGNIVVPGEMFEKYGVDAVRWYLFTMNDPGLPKRFNEKELGEVVKKFFMILWNIVSFHELYPPDNSKHSDDIRRLGSPVQSKGGDPNDPNLHPNSPNANKHVLDKWILARLNGLTKLVTERLEAYDVTPAGRAIQEFVADLSTWYVRRSRERMKGGDEEGKKALRYVLIELSKLMAPFVPFTAEALWQRMEKAQRQEGTEAGSSGNTIQHSNIRTNAGTTNSTEISVHLSEWPMIKEVDAEVLNAMEAVRKIVEVGLAARAAAKMPIRQPLACAGIRNYEFGIREEYVEILKDELNVKEVVIEKGKGELVVKLDTVLTEELKLEGMKRELIRAVNQLRKEAKLTIKDTIVLQLQNTKMSGKLAAQYCEELIKATISSDIQLLDSIAASKQGEVVLDGEKTLFGF